MLSPYFREIGLPPITLKDGLSLRVNYSLLCLGVIYSVDTEFRPFWDNRTHLKNVNQRRTIWVLQRNRKVTV